MVARWHSQDLANCITVLSAPFLPPKEFASISRHLKFLVSVHAGREYALNVVPLHLDGHRSWKSLFPQFRLPEPLEQNDARWIPSKPRSPNCSASSPASRQRESVTFTVK